MGWIAEAEDLRYVYPDGVAALKGVSFQIERGESVALVGANGTGKSTLLLLLAGCFTPAGGAARIGGTPLSASTLDAVRRRSGLVFQNPDDQLFLPTVLEDVAFGPLQRGSSSAEAERAARLALASVGADALCARHPHRLSVGEKRAVALAGILAVSPELLLLDEPTSGLDPRARRRIGDVLRACAGTKIVATHDLDFALDLCARTILLRDGTVAADGPSDGILTNEALLLASGLELPLRFSSSSSQSNSAFEAGTRPE